MELDEYNAILASLDALLPDLVRTQGVLGLKVVSEEDGGELQIRIVISGGMSAVRRLLNIPRGLVYVFEGVSREIEIVIEEGETMRAGAREPIQSEGDRESAALVHSGDFAKAKDSSGFGTVGWNFFLDGDLCALSNWHIFCLLDQHTPPGSPVSLKGIAVAEVIADGFVQVVFDGPKNFWDFAVARYRDPAQAADRMRTCEDGSVLPYPVELASSFSKGDRVSKVGQRGPVCDFGLIKGWAEWWVDYKNGKRARFSRQILLEKITGESDSGSLIVRRTDNKIVGLNFAHNSTESLANPLLAIQWRFLGMRPGPNGRSFPAYQR